ncbi:MAG: DegV family EDD domain-containing protein [Lachnospiraceae bacterium]|nr:DegV family EDD domain-containing protein [Lachnospiraceae bacterium]
MREKILKLLQGESKDIKDRLFRLIILVASVAGVVGIVEGLSVNTSFEYYFIFLGLTIILAISLVLVFKYNKIHAASWILGVFIVVFAFPSMFCICGGLDGGAAIWFVLSIYYLFLMFRGKELVFFLCISALFNFISYYRVYLHPEIVRPLESEFAALFDSYFSVMVVGVSLGLLSKFQQSVYDKERRINEKQKEELEALSVSKDTFFASMSHELRTPINTIIGLNEMILREDTSAEVAENAEHVKNAGKMLLSLVNDILDLSQIETRQMQIVPVRYDFAVLIHELVDMIAISLREKGLEFRLEVEEDLPSVLYGDDKRIKQVLINLLTNAVKYTKEGRITLTVKGEALENDKVHLSFSVADTGIGIRKENLSQLYDSFQRFDQGRNARIEGTGLGLAISKQLVDLMGGQIMVDSIYTKGSVFTVTLDQVIVEREPVGRIKAEGVMRAASARYTQSFEAPEARILVVDDSNMNLSVVRKLLRETKVNVDTALSGEECLKMTKQKYYHVILLDHYMSPMDGVETLRAIRKQENGLCRGVPIIALTANYTLDSQRMYRELGFDDYLTKPIESAVMEEKILNYLPEDVVEYRLSDNVDFSQENNIEMMNSRRRKRIRITADCFCDINKALLEKYDIHLAYSHIVTATGRFTDTVEVDVDSIAKYSRTLDDIAKPEALTVEEYESFFADMLTEAEEIIHISVASGISRSYEHALQASKGFGHVRVIDSQQFSCGMGLLTLVAAQFVKERKSVDEICRQVEYYKTKVKSYFLTPIHRALHQRGYSNHFVNILCEKLMLHPEVSINKNRLCVKGLRSGDLDSARRRFIRKRLQMGKHIDPDVIYVAHAGVTVKEQETITSEIQKYISFDKTIVQNASVSNTSIGGIGTVGIAFFLK